MGGLRVQRSALTRSRDDTVHRTQNRFVFKGLLNRPMWLLTDARIKQCPPPCPLLSQRRLLPTWYLPVITVRTSSSDDPKEAMILVTF